MTTARVTQVTTEALAEAPANNVTQAVVEAVGEITPTFSATQATVEALADAANPFLGTQLLLEPLTEYPLASIVTQFVLETICPDTDVTGKYRFWFGS